MTELQRQFMEEKGVSFDGIPINGVHLEYITWLEAQIQALRQPPVSGSLPCHHNFIQKDTYWKSCTHCGMLAPLGQ